MSGGKKMGGYSVYQEGEGFVPGKERSKHNHPEVTVQLVLDVVDQVALEWMSTDFSVPWDTNVVTTEDEKIGNYSAPLAKEIRKMHRVSTKAVPLVVGCLGVVSGQFEVF